MLLFWRRSRQNNNITSSFSPFRGPCPPLNGREERTDAAQRRLGELVRARSRRAFYALTPGPFPSGRGERLQARPHRGLPLPYRIGLAVQRIRKTMVTVAVTLISPGETGTCSTGALIASALYV